MIAQEPPPPWDCLVVGAGISGLAARRVLRMAGKRVLLLEKSRGLGGRMATRRVPMAVGSDQMGLADLGAQFVSARGAEFRFLVDTGNTQAIWLTGDAQHPRYIHRDGMSQLVRGLLEPSDEGDAPILRSTRAFRFTHSTDPAGEIQVFAEGATSFPTRSLILTAPLPQSLELLAASGMTPTSADEDRLAATRFAPCLAAVFRLTQWSGLPAPGILKDVSTELAGIFDQAQKGVRTDGNFLVVHATPSFSREHWDRAESETLARLWSLAAPHLPGQSGSPRPIYEAPGILHRWRYCEPENPVPGPHARWEGPARIYLAGDAFGSPRVEGAFESGVSAACALLGELGADPAPEVKR